MAFTKRNVKDRVVQYPRRYQMVEVQHGIFDLIPVPGTITEEGTAINKAYLQPIEDGLEVALEKTGDGKDVIVTFTEATTEAYIASGEKLSVMFGKILKKFKSIVPITLGGTGANSVAGARNALGLGNTTGALPVANGGTGSTTAANARTALGVPPINHANSGSTYGLGSPTLHGHVKTINALTQASHVDGTALSAYQGNILYNKIINYTIETKTTSGTFVVPNNVHFLDVFLIGGGEGGQAGGQGSAYNGNPGEGGRPGGAIYQSRIPVTPGQSIPYVVGSGGSGGVVVADGKGNPSLGGLSSFGSLTTSQRSVEDRQRSEGNNGKALSTNFLKNNLQQTVYSGACASRANNSNIYPPFTSLGGGNSGQSAPTSANVTAGANATVYGCGGGGGGACYATTGAKNGGNGKSGIIYIGYQSV